MNRTKFSYLKWTPIAAGLAIAVLLSMPSSKATNQPAAVVADLAIEERIIANYADDLAAYDKQVAELGKKARLVNADIEAIERRSKDLESRLARVQSAASDTIRKLKAANEWDDVDSALLAKITDARRKSFFQESSFKQLLEESASNLTSRKSEIGVPLETLRKRLASQYGDGSGFQIVRASYGAPIPTAVMIKSARCMLAGIRLGVSGLVHGTNVTKRAGDGVDCHCRDMASACAAL